MGNQKLKWTSEEEAALRAGVAKHGIGKWKTILTDPQFASSLINRSNIDLKDKWRNLCAGGNVPGSTERVGISKQLTLGPPSSSSNPVSVSPLLEYGSSADPSESSVHKKMAPEYNAMIFEAISSMEGSNGLGVNSILSFIEQRHEVPQNFRKTLTSRLRRLVLQGQLKKVDNRYKTKTASFAIETLKQNDARLNCHENSNDTQKELWSCSSSATTESLEDAASYAAYRVAEAENKSYLAVEAYKEADRVSKIAQEALAMLQLAEEIHEHCSRGGLVLLSA